LIRRCRRYLRLMDPRTHAWFHALEEITHEASHGSSRCLSCTVIVAACAFAVVVLAGQDRFALKSANGIAFSEFKGYEAWQLIASSQADRGNGCGTSPDPGCIKSIVGNAVTTRHLIKEVLR
jgi:hypothetical protein